jgi:uroporphyrinogen-III synthase
VSIGPVTSEALRSRGQPVHREAARHDIQGLIEVLL